MMLFCEVAAVCQEIADGRTIQVRSGNTWYDVNSKDLLIEDVLPNICNGVHYRVRPPLQELWFTRPVDAPHNLVRRMSQQDAERYAAASEEVVCFVERPRQMANRVVREDGVPRVLAGARGPIAAFEDDLRQGSGVTADEHAVA